MHRIGIEAWRGFCRGTEVRLTFGDESFREGGFLLAAVLNRFFALYTSINTYTRTVVLTDQRGLVKEWEPMAGAENVL